MRSVAEHERSVAALIQPICDALRQRGAVSPEWITVHDPALSERVAAVDLASAIDLPPFENSQMDGYAVVASEITPGLPLPIGLTTAAGDPPHVHRPGTASPVMTGAVIPQGADAVIPIEAADPPRFLQLARAQNELSAEPETVSFAAAPPVGQFIRSAGSDLPVGSPLIRAGQRLTPSRIGLLANAGVAEIPVLPRVRVLLVATGDEVVVPGAPLPEGSIYDANIPLLSAALREARAEVSAVRIADRPEALRELLATASDIDLVVTSGGISMGAFEVVREALEPSGVTFTPVAMQPGGPQGAGVFSYDGDPLPVLCFPGNPVSAALSAELFLLPHLRVYAGLPERPPAITAPLAHAIDSPKQKLQLRRGRIDAEGRVHVTAPSSHLLADLANSDVIALIPVGVDHLPERSPVEVWSLHV